MFLFLVQKKPWNIINCPVYSLMTWNNQQLNMNLCTYVTSISMKPKRYVVGVYHNTFTHDCLQNANTAILQVLGKENLSQCRLLGFQSGNIKNKEVVLQKRKALQEWGEHSILKNVAAVMLLQKVCVMNAGDHDMVLFDVVQSKTFHDQVLMLDELRKAKMIRI